jgi:hypothetical protein
MMDQDDQKKLLEACAVLVENNVGDFVYEIRERCDQDIPEGVSTWEAPRVKAWGHAAMVLEEMVKKYRAHESTDR